MYFVSFRTNVVFEVNQPRNIKYVHIFRTLKLRYRWEKVMLKMKTSLPGRVALSVTSLATDACPTADPGVASSIPARDHTFVELIMKYFLRLFSSLPLNHSRIVVVSYKLKYVHEVLVNCLFKLAQEKVWLGELTVPP